MGRTVNLGLIQMSRGEDIAENSPTLKMLRKKAAAFRMVDSLGDLRKLFVECVE